MAKESAGLLVYKIVAGQPFVFLAHPGGPFWAKKDIGAWSIPKGELAAGEDPLAAARREFREEIGQDVTGTFAPLKLCRQPGGKTVHAWAVEADVDATKVTSNDFELEWPPRSGRKQRFPEVDRAAWFEFGEARRRILPGQLPLLNELAARLDVS